MQKNPYASFGLGAFATIASTALYAALVPWALTWPVLPVWALLLVVPLLGVGVAAGVGFLPREALWIATLALPLALLTIDLEGMQVSPLAASLRLTALHLLWASTGGGLAVAAWLGVPGRHLLAFLGAVGLKAQLVAVGAQLVLPGFVAIALLSLLEVVAARHPPGSWLRASLQALLHSPAAWAVALLCAGLGTGLSFAVPYLLYDVQTASMLVLDPTAMSFPVAWASGLAYALPSGLGLWLASRLLRPL